MSKRVLLFIPTLIIVTSLVFILLRVVPGDPAAARLAGASGEADYTEEDRLALAKKLGTDRPLINQYGTWVWGMLQGDFGDSFHYQTPVYDDLKRKFPVTIQLTIMALIMAVAVAVPTGRGFGHQTGWRLRLSREARHHSRHRSSQLLDRHHGGVHTGQRVWLRHSTGVRRFLGRTGAKPGTTGLSRPWLWPSPTWHS